jgi:hypothetical protein
MVPNTLLLNLFALQARRQESMQVWTQSRALVMHAAQERQRSQALLQASQDAYQQSVALCQTIRQQPWHEFCLARRQNELRQAAAKTLQAAEALLASFTAYVKGIGQPTAADLGPVLQWNEDLMVVIDKLMGILGQYQRISNWESIHLSIVDEQHMVEVEQVVSKIEQAVQWINAVQAQYDADYQLRMKMQELLHRSRRLGGTLSVCESK